MPSAEVVRKARTNDGEPLPRDVASFFGKRLGRDLADVRIHRGPLAEKAASALGARAFTAGRDIVFNRGEFRPRSGEGRRLLAHELVHTSQQAGDHEVRRQLATPLAPGGGLGGVMDRDRRRAFATAPAFVCSRQLQASPIGNHAYIEAPPARYAIISPLCPLPSDGRLSVITGTTAQKWDNSPDPCGKSPSCVPCHARPGVADVRACLRRAFTSYASLSLYKALGPNSNTFAGTLARACCADMVPKPGELGLVPGWGDAPAPARAGGTPCPPGPSC